MVQSATDETREIQNAHRLRLQDLKSRITEMEKARGEMMDYLAKVIGDLQKAQDYASRTAPLIVHKEDLEEADAEPQLDLSALKVDAAASALRDSEPKAQPGDPNEEVEIPGAIFSYPILRQQGEPILDEGAPPAPVPHKPVMPSFTLADDDEDGGDAVPASARPQTKRRRKAIMALRALHKKLGV